MTQTPIDLKMAISGKKIERVPEYWFLPFDGIVVDGIHKNLIVTGLNERGEKIWLSKYDGIERGGETYLKIENTEFKVLKMVSGWDEVKKITTYLITIQGSDGRAFTF